MNSDDIQRELDRLWARVSSGGPPSEGEAVAPYVPLESSSITKEASLEAISLIKRQHRSELGRLQQLLELKERSVRELSERLSAMEREVVELRRKSQGDEERIYQEVFNASLGLENAQKALHNQEARFREEEKLLRAVASQAREQLATEVAHWRNLQKEWDEREQQFLLDVKELQAAARKAEEEAGRHESAARRADADLKEAKTAIEKTLAELLKERQDRAGADAERDKALARAKEVEEHMRQLQNIWEEERKQWQELWQRERSTWESQRQEFAAWEDKVRKDREAWHSTMQNLEERETRYAGQMTELLRKSVDAGEKVARLLRVSNPEEAVRRVAVSLAAMGRRKAMALVAVAAALVAYPVWKAATSIRLKLVASHNLTADNPTAIAYDGSSLWLAEWGGDILSLNPDNPAVSLSRLTPDQRRPEGARGAEDVRLGAYHPVSLALNGDTLYSLDTAQGRLLRHRAGAPKDVSLSWPAPGSAPVALAHDGQNLWSYDAVTRSVYRHLGEGPGSQAESYALELDVLPTAMVWRKGRLWIFDSKAKQLMAFTVKGRQLKLFSSRRLDHAVQSMTLAFRSSEAGQRLELWTLSPAGPDAASPTLRKYVVR